jgi:ATP-dependent protease ClpP protease subunit
MGEVITQSGTPEIKSFLIKGTFDDSMLSDFLSFHRECVQRGISEAFLYIDSPGGYVHTFTSMQALVRSGEVLYHTIALGHACSAACFMTAMGNFRWAIPECNFMFHDAAWIDYGKTRELKESLEQHERSLKRTLQLFADQTKKPLEFWMEKAYEKYSNDFYFTAEEALEWGLIDFIGVPVIERQHPFFVSLPVDPETFKQKIQSRKESSSAAIDVHDEPAMVEKPKTTKKAKKKTKRKTKG